MATKVDIQKPQAETRARKDPILSPPAATQGASAFVWTAWALLVAANLFLVRTYGRTVPLWDDYLAIPHMTGAEPVTLDWLWAIHYNHRLPIPKILFVALGRLTHCYLPAGLYFNVLVLSALAAVFITASRRLRGWTSYADAFIPLVLLHYGHHRTLLWFWQTSIVVPIFLAGLLLSLVIRRAADLSTREIIVGGVCLLLLPFFGSLGLVFVPFMGLWLLYAGIQQLARPGRDYRRRGWLACGFVAGVALLVGLYFVGYGEPAVNAPRTWHGWPTVKPILRTSLQFLSTGLGHLPEYLFPVSGFVVAALLLLGGGALVVTWFAFPTDRLRTWGLLMFLAAMLGLTLGIGWGRSGPGWDVNEGLDARYVTFAAPGLLCLYFIWSVYPSAGVGQFFQMVLFTLLCGLCPVNMMSCVEIEQGVSQAASSLEKEMAEGIPPTILTDHFLETLYYEDKFQFKRSAMVKALDDLRDSGVGPFRSMQKDPSFGELPLVLDLAKATGVTPAPGGKSFAADANSFLTFPLEERRFVYAFRVRLAYDVPDVASLACRLSWNQGNEQGLPHQEQTASMTVGNLLDLTTRPPSPKELTVTFWVNERTDQFRLYPTDVPAGCTITAITLLVPKGESNDGPAP